MLIVAVQFFFETRYIFDIPYYMYMCVVVKVCAHYFTFGQRVDPLLQ